MGGAAPLEGIQWEGTGKFDRGNAIENRTVICSQYCSLTEILLVHLGATSKPS